MNDNAVNDDANDEVVNAEVIDNVNDDEVNDDVNDVSVVLGFGVNVESNEMIFVRNLLINPLSLSYVHEKQE